MIIKALLRFSLCLITVVITAKNTSDLDGCIFYGRSKTYKTGFSVSELIESNDYDLPPPRPTISIKPEMFKILSKWASTSTANVEKCKVLSKMASVSLRNMTVEEIYNGTFAGLANVRSLDLSGTGIRKILKNSFSGLSELQYLDLSYNPMHEIYPEVFAGPDKLLYIDLRNSNFLAAGGEVAVSEAGQLICLYLSENDIKSIQFFYRNKSLIIDIRKYTLTASAESFQKAVKSCIKYSKSGTLYINLDLNPNLTKIAIFNSTTIQLLTRRTDYTVDCQNGTQVLETTFRTAAVQREITVECLA